jgi:chemotaxis protein methyltransferase CheR
MIDVSLSRIELKSILEEIYCITGINFSEYSFGFIKRRTEEFMHENNLKSDTDFIYRINKSAGLASQYLEKIFVANSEFFRDAEIWNYFETKLLAKSLSKKDFKVWIPYAKDAKELLSLLYILGKSGDSTHIHLLVSAVTDKHLSRIRNGRFSQTDIKHSLNNIDILNSALDQDDIFQIDNEVVELKHGFKGRIDYEVNNFINDEYVLEFDIIFLRNVFIYFDKELQKNAEKRVTRALKKGGYLFLGFCERLLYEQSKYKQLNKGISIYKKKTFS